MDSNVITHLDKDIFVDLINLQEQKQLKNVIKEYICQVIDYDYDSDQIKLTISDGGFYYECLVLPKIKNQVQQSLIKNSVVKLNILYSQEKNMFLVIDFKKSIYYNCSKIGEPLQFEQGKINPNTSTMIPATVVNQQPVQIEMPQQRGVVVPLSQEDNPFYMSISQLDPYSSSFNIKGRITSKSQLRTWQKPSSTGKVFSIVICDGQSSVQASFFNDMADKYYENLEEGKVYSFQDGKIKPAGNFNKTRNNIEINFNSNTVIEQLKDSGTIPEQVFEFAQIKDIQNLSNNCLVDVLVLVESIEELQQISIRGSYKDIQKIVVYDNTGKIQVTFWGEDTNKINFNPNDYIILSGVMVKDYQGKNLNCISSTKLIKEVPNCPEYQQLLQWQQNSLDHTDLKNLSAQAIQNQRMKLHNIEHINNESQKLLENDDDNENARIFYNCLVTLLRIPEKIFYQACAQENCQKKVTESNNMFSCLKCGDSETFKPRFLTTLKFSDYSDQFWVSCIGETSFRTIFTNYTEQELYDMKQNDEGSFQAVIRNILFKEFKLKIIAQKNYYTEQSSIKFQAKEIKPMTPKYYQYLTDELKQINGE